MPPGSSNKTKSYLNKWGNPEIPEILRRFLWEPELLTAAAVTQWLTNQRMALSFRRWDYSTILHAAVSPIHKQGRVGEDAPLKDCVIFFCETKLNVFRKVIIVLVTMTLIINQVWNMSRVFMLLDLVKNLGEAGSRIIRVNIMHLGRFKHLLKIQFPQIQINWLPPSTDKAVCRIWTWQTVEMNSNQLSGQTLIFCISPIRYKWLKLLGLMISIQTTYSGVTPSLVSFSETQTKSPS